MSGASRSSFGAEFDLLLLTGRSITLGSIGHSRSLKQGEAYRHFEGRGRFGKVAILYSSNTANPQQDHRQAAAYKGAGAVTKCAPRCPSPCRSAGGPRCLTNVLTRFLALQLRFPLKT